jgi:hypothetical protein
MHLPASQPIPATQRRDFQQDRNAADRGSGSLHQRAGGGYRTAGRQHVVDDQSLLAWLEHAVGQFQRRNTVLQSVALPVGNDRQLARFPDTNHPSADRVSCRGPEQKTSSLDTDYDINLLVGNDQSIHNGAERRCISEYRRKITEKDS